MSEPLWRPTNNESCRAPEGVVVRTMIADANGVRNECTLKRSGNLWWIPDGSMYVYYTPTHWAPL